MVPHCRSRRNSLLSFQFNSNRGRNSTQNKFWSSAMLEVDVSLAVIVLWELSLRQRSVPAFSIILKYTINHLFQRPWDHPLPSRNL